MGSKHISNQISQELGKVPLLGGIFLAESGQLVSGPGFHDNLHVGHELRMYFLSAGTGLAVQNKKKVPLRQNQVFFQRPEWPITFQTDAQTVAELWWIDIYGPGVAALSEQLQVRETTVFTVSDPRFLQELKGIVAYNGTLSPGDMCHIQSGLYKLFAIMVEECTTSQWVITPHDDPAILYTGAWTLWPAPGMVHEEIYTASPKAYAECNFFGTGVKWVGTMNFDCGKADVIIDGIYQATIDTYSPVRLSKQLLYINTRLSYGNHIIKVFCTGEKNDKATNCDVVVESFQSLGLAESGPSARNASTQLSKKVADVIRECYARPLSIKQLSAIAGVSRSYLTAQFTSEMGVSPLRYLTRIRLTKAKELLRTTQYPIGQVAASVGYPDVFYFSRLFKKEEKVTPTQYRHLHYSH